MFESKSGCLWSVPCGAGTRAGEDGTQLGWNPPETAGVRGRGREGACTSRALVGALWGSGLGPGRAKRSETGRGRGPYRKDGRVRQPPAPARSCPVQGWERGWDGRNRGLGVPAGVGRTPDDF